MDFNFRSRVGLVRELVLDAWLYLLIKTQGKTYADFYGLRMNRRVKKNPNWGLNINKKFQLEYLTQEGLRPQNTVLDFGCGALAAGRYMIDFLEPQKYTGLDVSTGVLEEGKKRLAQADLLKKQPSLMVVPGGDISILKLQKFDFIWAQSVFTHMPPDEIVKLLGKLIDYMGPHSAFYATFSPVEEKDYECKILKDWYYNEAFMKKLVEGCGYSFKLMNNWNHPDAPGLDRMMKITLKYD